MFIIPLSNTRWKLTFRFFYMVTFINLWHFFYCCPNWRPFVTSASRFFVAKVCMKLLKFRLNVKCFFFFLFSNEIQPYLLKKNFEPAPVAELRLVRHSTNVIHSLNKRLNFNVNTVNKQCERQKACRMLFIYCLNWIKLLKNYLLRDYKLCLCVCGWKMRARTRLLYICYGWWNWYFLSGWIIWFCVRFLCDFFRIFIISICRLELW